MSHQDRREPLPEDYQFPTHGVDCDCVTCRNKHIPDPLAMRSEIVEPTAETPWAV